MSEPDLITVARAIEIIDSVPLSPRTTRAPLADAQGMHLAADIVADRDYPPFDKSLMDGFAVRCQDVAAAPVQLAVQGEIAAGQRATAPLKPGHAYAIMTGAPMPPGADGVVPVEETESVDAGRRVRVLRCTSPDKFITSRGGDCPCGKVVLTRGTRLEAPQLAVAASVGAASVEVFARPRVAMLSTGDELVPIDQTPGDVQIRNSNNIMITSMLRRLGCEVTDLGTAPDQPEKIKTAVEQGLSFDALFVTGGMSMGRYDFVPQIFIDLGCELKITKLKIKPGKPFVFACAKGQGMGTEGQGARGKGQAGGNPLPAPRPSPLAPAVSPLAPFIFGLPGNPVSGFVCTLRLASRLLLRLMGSRQLAQITRATLKAGVEANGGREFYQPGVLNAGEIQPLKWKGSADIYTLSAANALIIRPAGAPEAAAGSTVPALEMPV